MIHEKLKFIVKKAKLSHKELSDSIGCVPNTIFYYTSGRRKPTYMFIRKVAEKAEVNLEWLTDETMVIPPLLGHRLKQLRDSTGLSMKEFAAKLDKPESYIEAIENGDIYPSNEFLERARLTFKKSIDYYKPRNEQNVKINRNSYFNENYPELIDWIHEDNEFKEDFDSLISRWRRIKSLESRNQK